MAYLNKFTKNLVTVVIANHGQYVPVQSSPIWERVAKMIIHVLYIPLFLLKQFRVAFPEAFNIMAIISNDGLDSA